MCPVFCSSKSMDMTGDGVFYSMICGDKIWAAAFLSSALATDFVQGSFEYLHLLHFSNCNASSLLSGVGYVICSAIVEETDNILLLSAVACYKW